MFFKHLSAEWIKLYSQHKDKFQEKLLTGGVDVQLNLVLRGVCVFY